MERENGSLRSQGARNRYRDSQCFVCTLRRRICQETSRKPATHNNPKSTPASRLARPGNLSVGFGVPARDIEGLQQEGFPVAAIYNFPDFGGILGAGSAIMPLMNKAPHPNAARLFVN